MTARFDAALPEDQLQAEVHPYRRPGTGDLRLVYIPTHRDCGQVLRAVAEELRAAATSSNDDFQLLFIDDRGPELAEENRATARSIADEVGVVIKWLGADAWSDFVGTLVARSGLSGDEQREAKSALLKPSGSYAAGMNKAALFAAYLGAATLHRRDSDEFPSSDSDSGATTLTVEITALRTALPTGTGEDIAPYVVGSSVQGEPTKDHRDLISVSPDLAAELEAVGRRRRRVLEMGGRPVVGTIPVGAGIQIQRDLTGRSQVGVSASREVHHWIPEMPAVGILGTDHFQKGLLYQMDLPVYWHPFEARHEYEPWRAVQSDDAQLARYAVAELRHAVLRHYWDAANETLTCINRGLLVDGQFQSGVYAAAFTDVLDSDSASAHAVVEAFIDVHVRAAHLAAASEATRRLRIRLEALREQQPQVIDYVRESIQEFAGLAKLWPRLVSGTRTLAQPR